ncbi:MAG: zinc-dependent alcohol dehydrogenase family protein [Anaerolineae bacterium]|jgi:propanol-preferring alcohol dehydrogenase
MKAMLLREPAPIEQEPLELADLPVPEPGPHQVRINVHVCGICHTDLHTVEGDLPLPRLPVVPGHQVVGTVSALGEGAVRHKIGDRVGVAWLHHVSCDGCEYCTRGLENLCPGARFTGLHADGGYAEAMLAYEDFTYPIPTEPRSGKGFSDVEAAPLLCAGIIGYRALKISQVEPGQRLGMYGFGGSAHVTIQVALHWGCEVYVFTRSEGHRQLARVLGAVWVGGAEDTPPEMMHASIVFAPAGWVVPEALRVLHRGGTVALAGVTMTPIPELDYDRLLYWERGIRSVANFTRQDVDELLDYAALIPIKTTVQSFPLEQANQALLALERSQIDGAGVLVVNGGR